LTIKGSVLRTNEPENGVEIYSNITGKKLSQKADSPNK